MTAIMDAANAALRDYETAGVPASGDHDPLKSDLRALLGIVDAALASLGTNGAITVKKADRDLLYADLAHVADTLAIVYNDGTPARNGIYAKVGGSGTGSWAITALALPSTFATDLAEVMALIGGIEAQIDAAVEDATAAAAASAELAQDTLTTSFALGVHVTKAFATLADFSGGASLSNGDTAVIFADASPGNNIKVKKVGGVIVDGLPLAQARYQYERGTVTAGSNTLAGVIEFNAVWNSGANNDGPMFGIRLNIDPQSLTNFNPASQLLDLRLNSVSRFDVRIDGYMTIRDAAGTAVGGLRLAPSGRMELTTGIDAISGEPAPAAAYYWEGTVGEAAVLRGLGTNRFSIESDAAMVHIAATGRYEWEGLGAVRLRWAAYEAGSSIGKTIDFNNVNQTGTRPGQILSVSTEDQSEDLIQFCVLTDDDDDFDEVSAIDGYGQFRHGVASATAAVDVDGAVRTRAKTVAELATDFPSPQVGMRSFVSDANATTFYSAVVGGGTNDVPVFYGDGAWRIG